MAVLRTSKTRRPSTTLLERLQLKRLGWTGRVGVGILLLFLMAAALGPWLQPYDPTDVGVGPPFESPSADFLFGTDHLGRDVLSRVISAARIAVIVAVLSVSIALLVGSVAGATAGFFGGRVDSVISRLFDVLLSFPTLVLAIVLVAILGPGLFNAILAIAIVYTPRFGRIARSSALSVARSHYVEAARLAGTSKTRILSRHVGRNIVSPLIVMSAIGMSTAQLQYASLSFLGLGVNPPQADFGSMLSQARQFIVLAPHLVIFPTIALVVLIVGFNFVGDSLRDVLDPTTSVGRLNRREIDGASV